MKTGRTWMDVRRERRKAKLADAMAVSLSLRNFWDPRVLWRTFKFLYQNRKRQRVLAELDRQRMGFDWRDARPKKLQRQLGLLPKL
jgi:hypothetical protein